MKTFYWLEIWTAPQQYRRVCSIMGLIPESKPRSIIKIQPIEVEDEPQWYEIDGFLDLLEPRYEALAKAGVERKDISIWINISHEEEACEFFLDPMTIMRLGEEGIKPCITCWQGDEWGIAELLEAPYRSDRVVNIEGMWLGDRHESLGLPYRELTVQFDDYTYWTARLVTYHDVFHWRKLNDPANAAWQPGMILLETVEEAIVEQFVVDLLRHRKFEMAFRRILGEDNQVLPPTDEVALMVMHEAGFSNDLVGMLGLKEGATLQKRHFWTYRQQRFQSQPQVDFMSYFLDVLEGKYQELAGMGIKRRDIMLQWVHRYEGRCHLEFQPMVLERMGRNGIGLSMTCLPIRPEVSRCLD